jgi:hypothetical protein
MILVIILSGILGLYLDITLHIKEPVIYWFLGNLGAIGAIMLTGWQNIKKGD